MATYQKRGDKWRAIVRKKGVCLSSTFSLKKDAEVWARNTEIKIEKGVCVDAEDITFAALIGRYMVEIMPHKKGAQQEHYFLNKFIKNNVALVSKPAVNINKQDIVRWRDRRLNEVSAGTVLREWTILSSIFSHAVMTWCVLETNIFKFVSKPPKPNSRERHIDNDEIENVKKAFGYNGAEEPKSREQYTAWAFLFALETACRLGEITNLESQDIQGDLLFLRETKNGSSRYVPLSQEAKRLLNLIILPLPFTARQISSTFCAIKRQKKVKRIRFHDTRHEAIIRMAKKINNPLVLAKITGHKDLKILLNTYYNPKGSDLVGLLD